MREVDFKELLIIELMSRSQRNSDRDVMREKFAYGDNFSEREISIFSFSISNHTIIHKFY